MSSCFPRQSRIASVRSLVHKSCTLESFLKLTAKTIAFLPILFTDDDIGSRVIFLKTAVCLKDEWKLVVLIILKDGSNR